MGGVVQAGTCLQQGPLLIVGHGGGIPGPLLVTQSSGHWCPGREGGLVERCKVGEGFLLDHIARPRPAVRVVPGEQELAALTPRT